MILLKGFQPLCNITRSSILVVLDVLCLPLHFIVIVLLIIVIIITFIGNIIFIISIIIRIFTKSSLLFLGSKLTLWFRFFQFLHLSELDRRDHHLVLMHYLDIIIWHHLIALPRYYHLASFNYGDMKAKDIS